MKRRTYVICHMYISIDGKIDGEYMDEEGCDISGAYYDDVIFEMGSAMAGGRVTSQIYKAHADIDISKYNGDNVTLEDYIIKGDYYNFVFDRLGKCMWDTNRYIYGGKTQQIVEVVSSKISKNYLSFLRSMNISYIIADSVKEALEKIYALFGIERLVLTGGSIINGGFIKEDCIDEISLVMAPYVQGTDQYKQFAGSMEEFKNYKFVFVKALPLDDGGVQLIFKRER